MIESLTHDDSMNGIILNIIYSKSFDKSLDHLDRGEIKVVWLAYCASIKQLCNINCVTMLHGYAIGTVDINT